MQETHNGTGSNDWLGTKSRYSHGLRAIFASL